MTTPIHSRIRCILAGISGVCGVLMLVLSFAINTGLPAGAGDADLLAFARQNYGSILWGAWLQAVGPVLIVLFAFSLVHLAGAEHQIAGWMTFFGATILMTVSLIEITFYISSLHQHPAVAGTMSLDVISSVQHLYFIVAAPTLFFPLGTILCRSDVLPKLFGYLAMGLGALFVALGAIFMLTLRLPDSVTACGAVQAIWWLAAGITLIVRSNKIGQQPGGATSASTAGSR